MEHFNSWWTKVATEALFTDWSLKEDLGNGCKHSTASVKIIKEEIFLKQTLLSTHFYSLAGGSCDRIHCHNYKKLHCIYIRLLSPSACSCLLYSPNWAHQTRAKWWQISTCIWSCFDIAPVTCLSLVLAQSTMSVYCWFNWSSSSLTTAAPSRCFSEI